MLLRRWAWAMLWVAWVAVASGDAAGALHLEPEPAVTPLRENLNPGGQLEQRRGGSAREEGRAARLLGEPKPGSKEEATQETAKPEAKEEEAETKEAAQGQEAAEKTEDVSAEKAESKEVLPDPFNTTKPEEDPNMSSEAKGALLRLKDYKRAVENNQKDVKRHMATTKDILDEMQKRVDKAIGSNNCSALAEVKTGVKTLLGELQLEAKEDGGSESVKSEEDGVEGVMSEKHPAVHKVDQIAAMDPLKVALTRSVEEKWFEKFWSIRGADLTQMMEKATQKEVKREITLQKVEKVAQLQKEMGVQGAKIEQKIAEKTDKKVLSSMAELEALKHQTPEEITKNMKDKEAVAAGGEDEADKKATEAKEKVEAAEELKKDAEKKAAKITAVAVVTAAKADQKKAAAQVEMDKADTATVKAEEKKGEARAEQDKADKAKKEVVETKQQVEEEAEAKVAEEKKEVEKAQAKVTEEKEKAQKAQNEAQAEKEKAEKAQEEVEEEKKEVKKAQEEVKEEKKEAEKAQEEVKQEKKEVKKALEETTKTGKVNNALQGIQAENIKAENILRKVKKKAKQKMKQKMKQKEAEKAEKAAWEASTKQTDDTESPDGKAGGDSNAEKRRSKKRNKSSKRVDTSDSDATPEKEETEEKDEAASEDKDSKEPAKVKSKLKVPKLLKRGKGGRTNRGGSN